MNHAVYSIIFCSAVLFSSASFTAYGWGQTGHRITGAIAQSFLSTEAKQQVTAILGQESLARASTWPDEMRSNPAEFWQKTAGPWHYVSVPKGSDYHDDHRPKQGDAVSALSKFRKILVDQNSSVSDKQLALRFIVHIIGDLHQPLHAGNGTDRGGNDVKVTFFKTPTNLHTVWDSGLIDRKKLSYSEWVSWLQPQISEQHLTEWRVIDPKVWIKESILIRDELYPSSTEISWDYAYRFNPIIEQRLQQGGVRIAVYLNDIWNGAKSK